MNDDGTGDIGVLTHGTSNVVRHDANLSGLELVVSLIAGSRCNIAVIGASVLAVANSHPLPPGYGAAVGFEDVPQPVDQGTLEDHQRVQRERVELKATPGRPAPAWAELCKVLNELNRVLGDR